MISAGQSVFHLRISGRVQGVGFRYATRGQALRLGLRGWVRNRRDGGVEVLIAGDAAACDAFVAWARRGPPGARVETLEFAEPSADAMASIGPGFEQLATA